MTRRSSRAGAASIASTSASAPRIAAAGAIAVYRRVLSPLIQVMYGPACRFEPSCSEYARVAIESHGLVRGLAMAAWRVARCNPLGGHGYDPVPNQSEGTN